MIKKFFFNILCQRKNQENVFVGAKVVTERDQHRLRGRREEGGYQQMVWNTWVAQGLFNCCSLPWMGISRPADLFERIPTEAWLLMRWVCLPVWSLCVASKLPRQLIGMKSIFETPASLITKPLSLLTPSLCVRACVRAYASALASRVCVVVKRCITIIIIIIGPLCFVSFSGNSKTHVERNKIRNKNCQSSKTRLKGLKRIVINSVFLCVCAF